MAATVAFISVGLFALYLLATAWQTRRRAARYSRLCHTEQVRSVWAEAREDLFDLVRDEKLNPRSATFRVLFGLQTFVVRRPNAYEEIADMLQRQTSTRPASEEASWLQERPIWPTEMAAIMAKMARGTEMLALGYPGLPGKLLRFLWTRMPGVAAQLARRYLHQIVALSKTSEAVRVERNLMAARYRLDELSRHRQSDGMTLIPA